ncbi:sensor histidine kinase [Pelagibacterium limicola]|uniref:sensor histidine kinase n=1 Tax=Pelagibacterium limicola TaxID=2791022 RepID=UPI0018AF64FA|nr:ATP-binding protein [Pelagibacterium limicola]
MRRQAVKYALRGVLIALAVAGSATMARAIWETTALDAARATGETRASLVAEAISNAIGQNEHFPLVMALDPDVQAALANPGDPVLAGFLNRKLEMITAASSPAALYVMKRDGTTLSSSNWNSEDSFVGQNYSFRSYFTEAMATGKGSYFGIGATTGRAGYFVSRAVGANPVLGVAIAKIEFYDLEATWERSSEHIMVADSSGIVFLASLPDWKYRTFEPLDEIAVTRIEQTRQFAGRAIEALELEQRGAGPDHIWIAGLPENRTYLRQTAAIPELGWTVLQLSDLQGVADAGRDGMVIGGTGAALLVAILFYLAQRQHSYRTERRAREELEIRVAERTSELSEANAMLHQEVEERRRAEQELRATQHDLVQAGKLAALGQMSAAIAHEINQPLTAMRTYIATTRIFAPLGDPQPVLDNLDKVDGLAQRMGRITSHLKSFARKEGMGAPELVSVDWAILRAVDLAEVQARALDVAFDVDILPTWTMGNEVRLEQVILNLVRNALDAVAETEMPCVRIAVVQEAGLVRISVRDNGPGFTPEVLETLFDPFVTTKPSGAGLGLGLTISSEIVRDFGGTISARNHPQGGAELTVELKSEAAPAIKEGVRTNA